MLCLEIKRRSITALAPVRAVGNRFTGVSVDEMDVSGVRNNSAFLLSSVNRQVKSQPDRKAVVGKRRTKSLGNSNTESRRCSDVLERDTDTGVFFFSPSKELLTLQDSA
jgi:hypothetical protein